MRMDFSYLKGDKHASLFYGWDLRGKDMSGNPVRLYITYVDFSQTKAGIPNDITNFEANNVSSELLEETLVLLDESFVPGSCKKAWEYNPDQPRNLAKCVTVK